MKLVFSAPIAGGLNDLSSGDGGRGPLYCKLMSVAKIDPHGCILLTGGNTFASKSANTNAHSAMIEYFKFWFMSPAAERANVTGSSNIIRGSDRQ